MEKKQPAAMNRYKKAYLGFWAHIGLIFATIGLFFWHGLHFEWFGKLESQIPFWVEARQTSIVIFMLFTVYLLKRYLKKHGKDVDKYETMKKKAKIKDTDNE